MSSTLILFPIFPLVFLTLLQTSLNAQKVKNAVLNKSLDPKWLKFMPSWEVVPDEIQASREHLKNLHQAPIIFYVYCIIAYIVSHVTLFTLLLAWAYVFFRSIHFAIREINPKISLRRNPFAITILLSIILWIDLLVFLVSQV